MFGDWRLSMAAYNCGPKCVTKAIRRYNSDDFWYLVALKAIPKETRLHVPKIIAMRKIALNPQKYGFINLNYYPPLDYGLVHLKGSFSLSHLSNHWKIPYQELRGLNPKFKTDTVYSNIRVPASRL